MILGEPTTLLGSFVAAATAPWWSRITEAPGCHFVNSRTWDSEHLCFEDGFAFGNVEIVI